VLDAVFAVGGGDDLAALLALSAQIGDLLGTADGASLMTAYKRAANILRIETAKDGPHDARPEPARFALAEEAALHAQLETVSADLPLRLQQAEFTAAMRDLASLRPQLDAFFDKVTVNDPDPTLRRNRLSLLHRVRATMDRVADFSRIEG
jgi:glycyl-tRNA synthetase beta chain